MENKEIVFVGRMQNKTRDYIHNLEREVKLLEQENNQLKEKLNCDLKWALKYDDLFIEYQQLKEQKQELRSWLEEEKDRLARECSQIYEDSLGKTRLVNKDIFNEVNKILSKLNELEGGKNENHSI